MVGLKAALDRTIGAERLVRRLDLPDRAQRRRLDSGSRSGRAEILSRQTFGPALPDRCLHVMFLIRKSPRSRGL